MAAHPSILAWEIPWTEETSGQQSVGLQRVGHNLSAEQVSGFSFLSLKSKYNRHHQKPAEYSRVG